MGAIELINENHKLRKKVEYMEDILFELWQNTRYYDDRIIITIKKELTSEDGVEPNPAYEKIKECLYDITQD